MFLGAASKNFQKSASPRKIRERVRVFLGTASENFTQSQPLRKKIGNVPECFWGLFRGSPPKSASPEKHFRNVPECFRGPLKSPKKNSGTFPSVLGELRPKLGIFKRQGVSNPKCCWRLLLRMSPEGAPPTKIRERSCFEWGTSPKIGLPKKLSWLSKRSCDLLR